MTLLKKICVGAVVVLVSVLAYDALVNTSYEVEGICATYSMNKKGVVLLPSSFWDEHPSPINPVPLLVNHGRREADIIGKVTSLKLMGDRVLFRAQIDDTKNNEEVVRKVVKGELTGVSTGILVYNWIEGYIIDLELLEISLVVIPADPFTIVTKVRKKYGHFITYTVFDIRNSYSNGEEW